MPNTTPHNYLKIITKLGLLALFIVMGISNSVSAAVAGAVTETYLPDRDYNQCVVITRLLQYKSSGAQVTTLQNMLVDLGYLEMQPTGYFGRATEAAVRRWQYNYKIEPVGWTGPATRASIAAATCAGDADAIARARNGAPAATQVVQSNPAPVTINNPVNIPPVVVLATSTAPVIISSTTTSPTGINLSSAGGSFYLKRSPVNPLFFTYKVSTDKASYICVEQIVGQCASVDNYTQLISTYQPGYYDAISATDKWLLTLYYSPEKWGAAGTAKRVFFKASASAPAEYYVVKVVDSI